MLTESLNAAIGHLGTKAKKARVFGVDYLHMTIPGEGDLFLTRFGVPLLDHLLPCNWRDDAYYKRPENRHLRTRLNGSSHPLRITTKPVNGTAIDIVAKFCRVGQEVFLEQTSQCDLLAADELFAARWNNPFEEIGLLMELRNMNRFYKRQILTQRPLAIFVPEKEGALWQMGRTESKMMSHHRLLSEDQQGTAAEEAIELDIHRFYVLIYGWVKGIDAEEAFEGLEESTETLRRLTQRVHHEHLKARGYVVLDTKPAHFIVRRRGKDVLRDRNGDIVFALVDFELLQRTRTYEKVFRRAQRAKYLKLLGRRNDRRVDLPEDLSHAEIHDVEYVHGATSNRGSLWVVGRHPDLFDYLDASRWRKTPRIRLSESVFRTKSVDNVHIVYKHSRVGMKPQQDPASESGRRARQFGFNSPFEEVAIAEKLRGLGIGTTYPRGIYKTSHQSLPAEWLSDDSRYVSHQHLVTSDGSPVLQRSHDYYTLWGYWRGRNPLQDYSQTEHWGITDVDQAFSEGMISAGEHDDLISSTRSRLRSIDFAEPIRNDRIFLSFTQGRLSKDSSGHCEVTICINGYRAFEKGLLNLDEYNLLIRSMSMDLERHGYEALNLKGDHIILSMNPDGILKRDVKGNLDAVLCHFDQIRAPWMEY